MIAFDEAQHAVLTDCEPLGGERVALDRALGRVLADDVRAADDLIPFARSAMDGYAVRARDVRALPAVLPIGAAVYAAPGAAAHRPGTASAIATGAPIPAGADTVIPFEHVDAAGETITVTRPVRPGAAIFPPGDDARRGETLVARGSVLTAAAIGLLAAAGTTHVDVHRRPVVAVICGGDELVAIERRPAHGQVRDSNGIMLASALAAAGADVLAPVRLRDDRAAVRAALLHAFTAADLVVTTGGASVGERDFVKRTCAELGVVFRFGSVALRPAKPTAFGRRGAARIVVLPGNPAAAFVGLQAFVLPAVRALSGDPAPAMPRAQAVLDGTIHAKPGRHFAAFARIALTGDGLTATPLENQCSSLTRTAATGAGFIIVPPGTRTYRDGDPVAVDIYDWTRVTLDAAAATRARLALLASGTGPA